MCVTLTDAVTSPRCACDKARAFLHGPGHSQGAAREGNSSAEFGIGWDYWLGQGTKWGGDRGRGWEGGRVSIAFASSPSQARTTCLEQCGFCQQYCWSGSDLTHCICWDFYRSRIKFSRAQSYPPTNPQHTVPLMLFPLHAFGKGKWDREKRVGSYCKDPPCHTTCSGFHYMLIAWKRKKVDTLLTCNYSTLSSHPSVPLQVWFNCWISLQIVQFELMSGPWSFKL